MPSLTIVLTAAAPGVGKSVHEANVAQLGLIGEARPTAELPQKAIDNGRAMMDES